MDIIEKAYLIYSSFTLAGLVFIFIKLLVSKIKNRIVFMLPIGIGILTILVYSMFVFSHNYKNAMLFDSLYFILNDWVCFSMLLFVLVYGKYELETRSILAIPILFSLIDSVSLFVNNWTKHSFDLSPALFAGRFFFWSRKFTWIHYLHLGWTYVLICAVIVVLIYNAVKAPYSYKKNYLVILASFLVLVAANAVCYSLDLIVDASVLLYPVMGLFIYYQALYNIPRHILSNALQNVSENVDDAIMFFDLKKKCLYKNSLSKKLLAFEGHFDENRAVKFLDQARKNEANPNKKNSLIEFFMIKGEERQFEIEAKDISFENNVIGSYLRLSDKTEEIQKYLTQKFLANHDELTGLYNRQHFFEVCDEKLKNDPLTEYVMISSNIVQFKLLNELFGEETGNQVLIAIATAAKTIIIHDSVFGRINDDKFCCLARKENFHETFLYDIIEAAQSVIKDSQYKINLRMGICNVHGTSESAQQLYNKTQLVIKKMGNDYRKTVGWYDSDLMDELLRERQITNEFEAALEEGHIEMYLQPFVDSEKNISGAEALARWDHKNYGIMLPDTFIPILERSGLIHKLDTFIWERAANTLAKWQSRGINSMQISVNVSSKDFYYIDIQKEFSLLLKKYNFNPNNLKIEFTEESITGDITNSTYIFEKLKGMGYEIGIDDFGNGHSSLNMLKDINADILKMDMFLLQQNENPERNQAILNFITQVSRALGMKLISEGVENSEQLDMLKKLGCDYYQGFYFSLPLALEDFEKKYLEAR